MAIILDKNKCVHNHRCLAADSCPGGALTQDDENSYPKIDHTKCLECGLCTTICPNNALKQNA